ncbi:MAG: hypothetical protein Q8P46_12580 [Hyphomicrobiales bacterium]|nr:hypothetical protein [Hyphomicrobiales bacterium]
MDDSLPYLDADGQRIGIGDTVTVTCEVVALGAPHAALKQLEFQIVRPANYDGFVPCFVCEPVLVRKVEVSGDE